VPRPRPAFGHGVEVSVPGGPADAALTVLGCYHPSQQNTFTGRVTETMLADLMTRARQLAGR
jgi:uracil-DNA glycosylase